MEDDKKQKNHEFAERIDGLNNKIRKDRTILVQGYEYKWIPCRVLYNFPKDGEKTLVRQDTGEEVRIEDMTFAECQEALALTPVQTDASTVSEPSEEFKPDSEPMSFEEFQSLPNTPEPPANGTPAPEPTNGERKAKGRKRAKKMRALPDRKSAGAGEGARQ